MNDLIEPMVTSAYTNHPIDLALRNPGDQLALGNVIATRSLVDALGGVSQARTQLLPLYARHARGDWGEMSDEDKRVNNEALTSGEGRVMSSYTVSHTGEPIVVWIITEADRSVTTALLPDDY